LFLKVSAVVVTLLANTQTKGLLMLSPRSRLLLAFTLIAAIAFSTSPSFARGGRGGGGRGAGGGGGDGRAAGASGPSNGQIGSNFSGNPAQAGNSPRNVAGAQQLPGTLRQAGQGGQQQTITGRAAGSRNSQGTFRQQATQYQQRITNPRDGQAQQAARAQGFQQFQSGAESFSPATYANHPHADAAVVATAASVTAWTDPAYYVPNEYPESSTTNVYQKAPAEETTTAGTLPGQVTASVSADASEWMPLGTYSLVAHQNTTPSLMLQLAVDRAGQLGGVYYDSLTNTSHNIAGTLDRATQNAQWSLENNPQVIFQAPLNELLKPTCTVKVNLATGPQQWQLTRVEQEQK
jgi:hypothetical protein